MCGCFVRKSFLKVMIRTILGCKGFHFFFIRTELQRERPNVELSSFVVFVLSHTRCPMEKETDAHNLLRHWRSLEYIWLPYDWNSEDKEIKYISKEEKEQKYCLLQALELSKTGVVKDSPHSNISLWTCGHPHPNICS